MSNSKCSCLTCKKEVSSNHIHHHYVRSHTKEGQQLTSDLGKLGGLKSRFVIFKKLIQKWKDYYLNPKLCLECKSEIDWFRKTNSFCCSSCSASFNNKKRTESGWKQTQKKEKERRTKPLFTKISFCSVCHKCFTRTSDRKTCSSKCYYFILSETAKNNPSFGGNKNNHAFGWYNSPIAGKVYLESSYELRVAQELDINQVRWSRPNYISYNKNKKYFPDFYLQDYDVYLDPKNDFLIQKDQEKIQSVQEQNGVRVIILDKNNLTWKSIRKMLDFI